MSILLPSAAFALEGIGPRVTVTGTVLEVRISEKQAFDEEGGEVVIKAANGQIVTAVLTKDTQITSEGRMSRKYLLPVNIKQDMQIRVRGWRVDSKSLTASLFIIMNIELNAALSQNGVIQSIEKDKVTILTANGTNRTFTVTNETEVNLNYTLHGASALTLVGKQALLTLNPNDTTLVRIIRVTGDKPIERTQKPSTVEFGTRTID